MDPLKEYLIIKKRIFFDYSKHSFSNDIFSRKGLFDVFAFIIDSLKRNNMLDMQKEVEMAKRIRKFNYWWNSR